MENFLKYATIFGHFKIARVKIAVRNAILEVLSHELTQSDWQNVLTADYSKLNILTKLGKMDPHMGLLNNPEFFRI